MLGLWLWCAASASAAQPLLQVESVAGARAVKVQFTNPSVVACGVTVLLGDGREEKLRLEAREKRTLDHVYAQDGIYQARLRGELVLRGLRTVPPCDVDEVVTVQIASAAQPAPVAPQPAAPSASPAQVVSQAAVLPAASAPARPAAAPPPALTGPRPTLAPDPVPVSTPAARVSTPRQPDSGDDMLVWRRARSDVLAFVTASDDGRAYLVSGDLLRWAGFEVCWLALPGHAEAFGGDVVVQSQVLSMLERRLAAQTGGRAVSGRFVDCPAGGPLEGQADVLLIQRAALPAVRARMSGFTGFEPMGEVGHAELSRELTQTREAAARRAQVLASMLEAERITEEQRRRQTLAREFPYTATLRCLGVEGAVTVANCLSGRTLRSQLELRNGSTYRVFSSGDAAQAGTETAEGLVIPLRDRFTIETQNVHERLTLTLRVVNTASGAVVFDQSADRFEVLRLTR